MSCNPDDQLGTSPEEWSTHTVLPCPHNKLEMEDQHIWLGWCLLSWCFKKAKGSNARGCYVLHYMEQEIRLLRGEWPSVWPDSGWKRWKPRLETAVSKLMAEQKSITEAAKLRWWSLQSQKANIAEQKKKAGKAL